MYKMIPKTELSESQIQEIRNLRGVLPITDIKKRFNIGSQRLYKIWRDAAHKSLPAIEQSAPTDLSVTGPQQIAEQSSIQDFYNRLVSIESRMASIEGHIEQNGTMLVDALSMLDQDDNASALESIFGEESGAKKEPTEEVEETQEEMHFDLQKIGQMVEQTKNFFYISTAVMVAWNVLCKTWKHCEFNQKKGPPVVHPIQHKKVKDDDKQFIHWGHDYDPNAKKHKDKQDPFYME